MKMKQDEYYGVVYVSSEIFDKLNVDMLISGGDDNVKFMCANELETNHLINLGIDINNVVPDWYKIVRKTGET